MKHLGQQPHSPYQQPPPLQINQGVPVIPPLQPDQVEMSPDYEMMELDIPEDLSDLLEICKGAEWLLL